MMHRCHRSAGLQRAWLHRAADGVDVDDGADVLPRHVREHRGRDGAGVVDEDVQRAPTQLGRRRGGFTRGRQFTHVEDERLRSTARGGDRFRGGHRGILVDVAHQNGGPRGREGAGDHLRRLRCPHR